MAQMEVYDVLKKRVLKGDKTPMNLLSISDNIIEGIKKGNYCGSFDTNVLDKDCKRLCALGLAKKRRVDGKVAYRLNERCLEDN